MAYYGTLEYKQFDNKEDVEKFINKDTVDAVGSEFNGEEYVVFYYRKSKVYNWQDDYDEIMKDWDYQGEVFTRDENGKWVKKNRQRTQAMYEDLFGKIY